MIFLTGRMKTGEEESRASARLTCLLAQPQDTPHASCYASYTPLTSTHTHTFGSGGGDICEISQWMIINLSFMSVSAELC